MQCKISGASPNLQNLHLNKIPGRVTGTLKFEKHDPRLGLEWKLQYVALLG